MFTCRLSAQPQQRQSKTPDTLAKNPFHSLSACKPEESTDMSKEITLEHYSAALFM